MKLVDAMTMKEVKAELASVGIVIHKYDGEYRVNLKGGQEVSAYYTNDLSDAYLTGLIMADDAKFEF